jgi:GxxExxY protein
MTDPNRKLDLPHGDTTEKIIGAFFETVRELGCGFHEAICRRALAMVLASYGLKVQEEISLPVWFRGQIIGTFRADLVVGDVVLVEVKATPVLESSAEAQLLNYLKAAGGGVGLVLNFGKSAAFKRVVMGADPSNSLPAMKQNPPRD